MAGRVLGGADPVCRVDILRLGALFGDVGARLPAQLQDVLLARVDLHDRSIIQAVVRDITERKAAEKAVDALEGVLSVTAVLTAHREAPGGGAPPQAGPAQDR